MDKFTHIDRDDVKDGARFWTTDATDIIDTLGSDLTEDELPYGKDTVGIVDENEGGVIAYCHKDTAPAILDALRVKTGNN